MKGQGGHMDAALLHEIAFTRRIMQRQIDDAEFRGKISLVQFLAQKRDRIIGRLQDRLRERGYYREVA